MPEIEKARQLFQDAGLTFPTLPENLAAQMQEVGPWLFSTRPISISPYNLQHYLQEVEGTRVEDYAVLSHSGHGVNSYAIHYYLVRGSLRLFLQLGWGGVYMDAKEDAAKIHDCFLMADKIVASAHKSRQFQGDEGLTVVGSDFYGSYWLPPGNRGLREEDPDHKAPVEILTQVFGWLNRPDSNADTIGGIVDGQKKANASWTSPGRKAAETKGRIERVREAKMAAWTRKHGKNDALNPHSKENFYK